MREIAGDTGLSSRITARPTGFSPGRLRFALALITGLLGASASAGRLAAQTAMAGQPATAGRSMSAITGPSLVVLVRHAEKATAPASDPDLSAAGVDRARALADALVNLAPTAIIVTPTRRTAQTAEPLAKKYGVTPETVPLAGGQKHIDAVAEAVMKHEGVVVVVGHSNTIPAIIKALGGPEMPDLCDSEYNNVFVLKPGVDGKPAELIRAQYGAPDPPRAADCAALGR